MKYEIQFLTGDNWNSYAETHLMYFAEEIRNHVVEHKRKPARVVAFKTDTQFGDIQYPKD